MQEKFGSIHAALRLDLPAQIVGGRFAEQRFAAARRAVEQKTFRHRVLETFEQVAV